ncbi:amino acid permease [Aestuariivivens sediminis]|uniref:amino acid permease n=1 Tax=Aestuariivivens sediminis TaxID=2913557 RepID=UPI001F5862B9|nr:amino acid permease [Aestuariivivens sediminis]
MIKKNKFGTSPVFFTAISTILGAIMFLRFGFAVGSVGFLGAVLIILIGHMVTIPTAMALAEIATNQKVEGGGEYFIISRSFGINIGSAIGIALYFSQAISVAFYIIAFGEAFEAIKPWVETEWGYIIYDNRLFSVPALLLLIWLMVKRGANLGVKALYMVVTLLGISLILFFCGTTGYSETFDPSTLFKNVSPEKGFFYVFAIIFPAFTGMTAGVGLSGDLKDPKRSIPLGTLTATIVGMIIYFFIAYKLASSASSADLIENQLIMAEIAIWGPIIPIGLAAATISSALGSFMVAPRTLQAIGGDKVFPNKFLNFWVAKGTKNSNEPRNATIVTSIIALLFVLMGDVNAVAEIITMFFMVTYGSLCLISFFQHFAADPSYRPSFKSKWYLSFLGAIMCVYLMFKINTPYALTAVFLMVLLYVYISSQSDNHKGMANIFQGVIQQLSRRLQVFLQKSEKASAEEDWRPSVVCLAYDSFERFDTLELMKWISHSYGFGMYVHLEHAYLSSTTKISADEKLERLIHYVAINKSNVFVETLVSPSTTSAIAFIIQLPGISGQPNNMVLFEFKKGETAWLSDVLDNYNLIKTAGHDVCILASSDKGFGFRKEIHIWIKKEDYENANLMILLSYIILGHADWKHGQIKIFAAFREENIAKEQENLIQLCSSGRLPISPNNINVIPLEENKSKNHLINKYSEDADLTLIGFHEGHVKSEEHKVFEGYENIGNILFVNTLKPKFIK